MSLSSGKYSKKTGRKRLNLALQGGGAHGAFTWGVLDRLLEEEDIEIVGISGTSAGAMNAAVLIDGMNEGGRAMARDQLAKFWFEISKAGEALAPFMQTNHLAEMPGMEWLRSINPLDMLSRVLSPYELNPMNLNPLRDILESVVQVENLAGSAHLFVAATNVETGQARIFSDAEVTIDVLMASACLPFLYQAVEIDGVPYWDGGYAGNPAIWPLIYKTTCADTLLVQINPITRPGTPKHSIDIINRLNEISFNSSLIAELRAIYFVKKLIARGHLDAEHYTDVRMHMVHPPEGMSCMTASSKMNADWAFFQSLHAAGRNEMEHWLREHKAAIGERGTMDVERDFLAIGQTSAKAAPRKTTKGKRA